MAAPGAGRVIAGTFVASAAPFVLVTLVPALQTRLDVASYLAFHNTAEFFSVVVSLSVFGVGWIGFRQSGDRHALLLGGVFLATGLLDFVHTLGNAAMPEFLTPNSTNKSTQFWLAARLVNAAGLVASTFVRPGQPLRWLTRRTLLAAALLPCAAVFVAVTFFEARLPATFAPGSGLTPVKVGGEWAVIVLLAAAAARYAVRFRQGREAADLQYAAACVVGIFGEAAFASYASGFDTYNVLGHVYKAVAFYLVYRASVVAAVERPYLALRALNAELEQRVTERTAGVEAAHAALRDASRHKDEFLGMLSHELRNPLAPIHNAVHVLERTGPASEQAGRARAVIHRQAEHLARLVDDLLDVTRIARGRIELRRTRLDLGAEVRRAAEDFRSLVEGRGLAFRVSVPEARLWCDADATRVTQILGNLVHNAAKFTRPPGEVAVTLRADGGTAELRVRDTGAGIDPALLPQVFDAFVQGSRTLERSEGGLGLGLALVKGIAELHGGSVAAESGGPGRGTEIAVRLPLAAGVDAVEPAPSASPRPRRPRRVLVVDDNADAAETLSDLLRMLGHAVDVAYDGPGALARAREGRPEVVLCDLGLPGMSGYDVARALRASAADVRLFAVSGYARPEDVRRAVEAGFDGHVSKPCDLADIERLLA